MIAQLEDLIAEAEAKGWHLYGLEAQFSNKADRQKDDIRFSTEVCLGLNHSFVVFDATGDTYTEVDNLLSVEEAKKSKGNVS